MHNITEGCDTAWQKGALKELCPEQLHAL